MGTVQRENSQWRWKSLVQLWAEKQGPSSLSKLRNHNLQRTWHRLRRAWRRSSSTTATLTNNQVSHSYHRPCANVCLKTPRSWTETRQYQWMISQLPSKVWCSERLTLSRPLRFNNSLTASSLSQRSRSLVYFMLALRQRSRKSSAKIFLHYWRGLRASQLAL